MKKKIINLEPKYFSDNAKKILIKYFKYIEYSRSAGNIKNQIQDVDIIISRFRYKLDKNLLLNSKKLKYIISASTGLDHIDLDYIKRHNIRVLSLNKEFQFLKKIKSLSEHTWALLLSLLKNIPKSFDSVKELKWNRYKFLNNNLYNKKIGIVGLGRNGRNIKKYAESFDMKIITCDKKNKNYKLNKIFENCDVVVLTIELNDKTKNIINSELLDLVKKNFYLINTSRAEIINQNHLIKKIKKNKNFYFATDFLKFSSNSLTDSSKKLIKMSKSNQILITPHIAGASLESWNLCEEYLAKKIAKYA